MKGFSSLGVPLLRHAVVVLLLVGPTILPQCTAFGPTMMVSTSSTLSTMTKNTEGGSSLVSLYASTTIPKDDDSESSTSSSSLSLKDINTNQQQQQPQQHPSPQHHITRRSIFHSVGSTSAVFLTTTVAATVMTTSFPPPVYAMPMASVDEFSIILRDSPLSVQVVEFSGPKSENVVVKLVDGTTFGIKDIIESSTDPRSPLKVAASCREEGVKTRFVDLEAMLASAPKKKKMYTNQRVQDAQEKERARLERIQKDEEDRLAQVAKMELEEQQQLAAGRPKTN
jgi:hypothetical protein